MTTQYHDGAITVPDSAWVQGGSDTQAYISPWYTTTLKHRDLDRQQGTLTSEVIAEAVRELHQYTAVDNQQ
jgi:hypothetical protein